MDLGETKAEAIENINNSDAFMVISRKGLVTRINGGWSDIDTILFLDHLQRERPHVAFLLTEDFDRIFQIAKKKFNNPRT